MIQGGDPLGQGTGRPRLQLQRRDPPASSTSRQPYILAMANAGLRRNATHRAGRGHQRLAVLHHDRPRPPWLQGKHTIFGEVADDASREVVDAIGAVPTAAGDRPIEPVVIAVDRHRRGLGRIEPRP